ncbi:MAG: PEP-CTERM sorting domain-containing protein [Sedimentisphaerales bacterium]
MKSKIVSVRFGAVFVTILLAIFLLSTQSFAIPMEWLGDVNQGSVPGDPPGCVLDQDQETESGGGHYWANLFIAQTFTAGLSGQLDHIDAEMGSWFGPPSYPTTVEIRATVDDAPTGDILGSVYAPNGFSYGWDSIDFLPEDVFLTAGNMYAIVFWNDDQEVQVAPSNAVLINWYGDPYHGGTIWAWAPTTGWEVANAFGPPGDADMAFRTWMVPEPATLFLFGLGGLALLRKRRK